MQWTMFTTKDSNNWLVLNTKLNTLGPQQQTYPQEKGCIWGLFPVLISSWLHTCRASDAACLPKQNTFNNYKHKSILSDK